jgi:hypothetical protein
LFENEEIKKVLIPQSFISICSPHLGVRRPLSGNLFKNLLSFGVHTYCNFSGISQQELIIEDEEKVLFHLCKKEYLVALNSFKYKTLISIPNGDYVVPFCSSSIKSNSIQEFKETPSEKIQIIPGKIVFQKIKLPSWIFKF